MSARPLLRALPRRLPAGARRTFSLTPRQLQGPGLRQPPNSNSVHFPGAVRSEFTSELRFRQPDLEPAMPTYRILNSDGAVVDESVSAEVAAIGEEKAQRMYKAMVTTSIMDGLMYDSQRQGRISFYMVSAGEEGVAVGSAAALDDGDVMYSQYREQGALMYKGYTLDEFMNQLFANKHDYGKGRNMPVHYQSERLNLHPVSSTLATQLPTAVGAAYALKLSNKPNVVACYFGEGAASEGDFHSALNIAATRSCPVLFICRNNGYAISTPSLEQYKGDGIASRGVGYGIHTIRVDGNDIMAVHEVTKRARDIAVKEQRPVLIEAMTYRVGHHSTSDDSFAYRGKSDVEDWKRRDNPITRMRKWLEAQGWWSAEQDEAFRKETTKQVRQAFAKAEKVKKPALANIFTDIYAEPSEDLKEQRQWLKEVIEKYPNEYDVESFDGGKDGL